MRACTEIFYRHIFLLVAMSSTEVTRDGPHGSELFRVATQDTVVKRLSLTFSMTTFLKHLFRLRFAFRNVLVFLALSVVLIRRLTAELDHVTNRGRYWCAADLLTWDQGTKTVKTFLFGYLPFYRALVTIHWSNVHDRGLCRLSAAFEAFVVCPGWIKLFRWFYEFPILCHLKRALVTELGGTDLILT